MFDFIKNRFREEDNQNLNYLIYQIIELLNKPNKEKDLIKSKILLFFNLVDVNDKLNQLIKDYENKELFKNFKSKEILKDYEKKQILENFEYYNTIQNFLSILNKIKKDLQNENYDNMKANFKTISQINIFNILKNHDLENSIENTFMYQIIEEEFKCGIIQNKEIKDLALNELKMIILLIVNDIKNIIRKEFDLEFNYNILKDKDDFKKNEEKLIKTTLLIIKEQIGKFIKIMDLDAGIYKSYYANLIIKNIDFREEEEIKPRENWTKNHLKYLKFGICRHFSFFYLSIFQILNFPLTKASLSSLPAHISFRYKLNNGNFLNFETMFENWKKYKEKYEEKTFEERNETPFLDDFEYKIGAPSYFKYKTFSNELIKKGIYLNFLSKNQLVAKYYGTCADILRPYGFENHEKALKYYEKAISLDPNDPNHYNNYALLCEKSKVQDYKRALKYYEKAIGLNPNYAIFYKNCASLLCEEGKFQDYKRALKYYEIFIEKTENLTDYDYDMFLAKSKIKMIKSELKIKK